MDTLTVDTAKDYLTAVLKSEGYTAIEFNRVIPSRTVLGLDVVFIEGEGRGYGR